MSNSFSVFGRGGRRQRGIILMLIVVGMTSILGLAGLALDFGLAFLTKSRIQNALDAAALSGAKSLKRVGDEDVAIADATAAFNDYLGQLNRNDLVPVIEFSSELTAGTFSTTAPANANFVRVKMPAGYTIPTYLTKVFPGVGDSLTLSGSAVAGAIAAAPPGKVCDLVPIVADSPKVDGAVDTNCAPDADGVRRCYGYTVGQAYILKEGDSLGPGNFNLLALNGEKGGKSLAQNVAGSSSACRNLGTGTVGDLEETTEPGNMNGPFSGIDTRFGIYSNTANSFDPAQYPPDINVRSYTAYSQYEADVRDGVLQTVPDSAKGKGGATPPKGVPGRRIIRIAFADFANAPDQAGRSNLPVSGFGCFFLLEPVIGQGNAGGGGGQSSGALDPAYRQEDSYVAQLLRPRSSRYELASHSSRGRLIKVQGNSNNNGNNNGSGNNGGGTSGGFVSACEGMVDYQGGNNGPQRICAEFISDCNLPEGGITGGSLDSSLFFRIVLYKDPESVES